MKIWTQSTKRYVHFLLRPLRTLPAVRTLPDPSDLFQILQGPSRPIRTHQEVQEAFWPFQDPAWPFRTYSTLQNNLGLFWTRQDSSRPWRILQDPSVCRGVQSWTGFVATKWWIVKQLMCQRNIEKLFYTVNQLFDTFFCEYSQMGQNFIMSCLTIHHFVATKPVQDRTPRLIAWKIYP